MRKKRPRTKTGPLPYRALSTLCAIVIAAAVTILRPAPHPPETFRVTRVIDGDTIVLENEARVRYIGINTPELKATDPRIRAMAYAAKRVNEQLVLDKEVRLAYDVERFDKYHRLLAYVYVDDLFVNAELVKRGYAAVYTFAPNVRFADQFRVLQRESKKNQRGLWAPEEE